jgi:succinate dehydrogenase hydrophobic anchor subunit
MNLAQNKVLNIFLIIIFGVVTVFYIIQFFREPQNQLFDFIAVAIGLVGVWLSFRDYKKSQKAEIKSQNDNDNLPQ